MFARQNSGMFQSALSPTVTGHWMLAVTRPARAATSQSVGTRMSSAYQYQPDWLTRSGSNAVLARMPWVLGHTPVTSVVWLG